MNKEELSKTSGLTPQIAGLIFEQLEQEDRARSIHKEIGSGGKVSVLKDEEFPFLKDASTSIVALITGAGLASWAPGAVAGLVVLLFRIKQKKIVLGASDALLLRTIKNANGISSQQIAKTINLPEWDTAAVDARLKEITRVRRADSTSVTILQHENDRWYVDGI